MFSCMRVAVEFVISENEAIPNAKGGFFPDDFDKRRFIICSVNCLHVSVQTC